MYQFQLNKNKMMPNYALMPALILKYIVIVNFDCQHKKSNQENQPSQSFKPNQWTFI